MVCFCLFSFVTLYKGITGAASCGCFGSVHINPWLTLFAIDLPAVLSLAILRPRSWFEQASLLLTRRQQAVRALIGVLVREFTTPLPSIGHFGAAVSIGVVALGVTMPILALNEPAKVTSSYEVLEPESWPGKELPILEHIDIAESLRTGNWLILLYHYDCPDCAIAIPKYEQMAGDLAENEAFLRIAFIEVPPYGPGAVRPNSPCTLGRLDESKEWFVTSPAVALLSNAQVTSAWEAEAPDFDAILTRIAGAKNGKFSKNQINRRFLISTNAYFQRPKTTKTKV